MDNETVSWDQLDPLTGVDRLAIRCMACTGWGRWLTLESILGRKTHLEQFHSRHTDFARKKRSQNW